jgi:hypothetical protein
MDTYFTEINHVLQAFRGYEYDGFLFVLNILFLDIYYCDKGNNKITELRTILQRDTIKFEEKTYT